MSNEIITLVKDTSLARVIAVYEIIWNAQVYIKTACNSRSRGEIVTDGFAM